MHAGECHEEREVQKRQEDRRLSADVCEDLCRERVNVCVCVSIGHTDFRA